MALVVLLGAACDNITEENAKFQGTWKGPVTDIAFKGDKFYLSASPRPVYEGKFVSNDWQIRLDYKRIGNIKKYGLDGKFENYFAPLANNVPASRRYEYRIGFEQGKHILVLKGTGLDGEPFSETFKKVDF